MSLQAVQERFPWLMIPLDIADAATSARRWICLQERVRGWVIRTFGFDSLRIAQFLSAIFGVFTPVRVKLVTSSSVLMHLDWATRRFVWSLLWGGTVLYRSSPKKAPIPRREKIIHLISAPESFEDFHSPLLLVPEDVPCAESSLVSGLSVALLHLMQDIYPVITTHQPVASSDPVKRMRDAYPFIYRLVREPPVWHPDLIQATNENNLLGALAVGGPFAKLLRSEAPNSDRFFIDLRYMKDYPVREGLCLLGCRINYVARGGKLYVASIEYQGDLVCPTDDRWEITHRIALASLVTHLTVWHHGMQYHVAGLAPFAVVTHNLPPEHPLRRLLAAHISQTISTNFYTHLTLRRSGFDVTGFSFPREVIFRYYDAGAEAFDIARLDVKRNTEGRGIPDTLYYPYLPGALRYYELIERYVRAYVDHYYSNDQALEHDSAANIWFNSLDSYVMHGIRGYVPSLTRENLTRLCTLFIYSVTVEHEQNTLWDYSVFLPTTVRQDGVAQSVGEVQSVMNFQIVISSATNRLINDISYLALDEGAAQIMREFRASLLALQAEMETEPDEYWRVYPQDLEASVSA
jgi:hypothetical protein